MTVEYQRRNVPPFGGRSESGSVADYPDAAIVDRTSDFDWSFVRSRQTCRVDIVPAQSSEGRVGTVMYAVLDVETTGLNPTFSHRVCEIAVIHVDRHGRVEREWCSLVNPERTRDGDTPQPAAQPIADNEFSRAPTFDRLAGQVAKLLVGRLIVAHDPAFDVVALRHEFNLLGIEVPLRPELGLSTMALAAQHIPLTGRPLYARHPTVGGSVDGVKTAGDEVDDLKAAGGDLALVNARAAAGLLTAYLSMTTEPPPWAALLDEAARQRWPSLAVDPVVRPTTERTNESAARSGTTVMPWTPP